MTERGIWINLEGADLEKFDEIKAWFRERAGTLASIPRWEETSDTAIALMLIQRAMKRYKMPQ